MGADRLPFANAPADTRPTPPRFAAQYQFQVALPEGTGLARFLLDVGVKSDEAAAAARLAAGHLGAGAGGCDAKVAIEKGAGGSLDVVRVQLSASTGVTVIERRGRELVIASETRAGKAPPLV